MPLPHFGQSKRFYEKIDYEFFKNDNGYLISIGDIKYKSSGKIVHINSFIINFDNKKKISNIKIITDFSDLNLYNERAFEEATQHINEVIKEFRHLNFEDIDNMAKSSITIHKFKL